MVTTITAAMAETFQFREATVFVREPDAAVFRAHATVGQDPEIDRRVLEILVPEEVFTHLFQERFQIGRSYFIDHREYEMDEADAAYFPAPDIGERPDGEWHQDDTLFVPLYDREGKLGAVLDLYDPTDRRLPSLELIKPLEVFATHAAVAIENARYYEELQSASAALEEQLRVRHELLALSEVLLSTLDQRAVFEQTSTLLKQMVDYETLDIRLVDEESQELVAIYARDTNADEMLDFRIPLDQGLSGWVVRHNQAQLVKDAGSDPRGVLVPGTEPEPQSSIVVPLQVRGKVIGVLTMDRLGGRVFEERELEPARLFANLAAIAIQNARTFMEMEVQAISDGLTGIHNYRHFQETLKASVSRAGRYGETFCLLMMDLDHFKAVNDTVGHQQGDEVLRSVAGALRRCSRDSDYLARYGGEEFVMLLPQTSLVEARNMADRICAQVRHIDPGSPDLAREHVDRRGLVPGLGRRQRRRVACRRRRVAARQGARPQPRVPVHGGAARSYDARGRARRPGPPFCAADRPVRGGDRRPRHRPGRLRDHRRRARRGARRPRACPGRDGGCRGGCCGAGSRRALERRTTRCSTAASIGTGAATRTACAASASLAWRAPSPSAASTARPATRRRTATASPSCAPRRRASSTHAWCSASPPSWARRRPPRRGSPRGRRAAARRPPPADGPGPPREQLMVAAGRGVPY